MSFCDALYSRLSSHLQPRLAAGRIAIIATCFWSCLLKVTEQYDK